MVLPSPNSCCRSSCSQAQIVTGVRGGVTEPASGCSKADHLEHLLQGLLAAGQASSCRGLHL